VCRYQATELERLERQPPKEGAEVSAMVNKDQLDQTGEGKEVLGLLEKNFAAEQFQPALTLIEQLYTEDETVWDASLNSDSKLPFLKTDSAHRLLVFFASPSHVAKIKAELEKRAAEAPIQPAVAAAGKARAAAKPKAKRKTNPKARGAAQKARGRKGAAAKTVKQKPRRAQRSKPALKRSKRKSMPVRARKSRAKKH
jgi:hypothetical protein